MTTTTLGTLVYSFFLNHLAAQKGLRPATIRSYRDTLRLFLAFVATDARRPITQLSVEDLTFERVLAFLQHLETARRNHVPTRNQRLAALRTFFEYLGRRLPERLQVCEQVAAIPIKRTPLPAMRFLDRTEITTLFAALPREGRQALRDRALLMTLYNTGARVQEIADLRVEQVCLTAPLHVRLRGKGDKWRTCPLWEETARVLRRLLEDGHVTDLSAPVFTSASGRPLTRFGIYKVVRRHVGNLESPTATKAPVRRITPHVFRHTAAVHLLEAGVEVNVIRGWLGHVSLETTNRYAEITVRMKEAAMKLCEPTTAGLPVRKPAWRDDAALLTWLWRIADRSRQSVPRRRWRIGRLCASTAVAIPQRVLPAVDHAVVAAERTLPDNVSVSAVEFRDDVASTPPTAGTAPAGDIRVLVALRQVVRDPGHDGAEEDGQTHDALRDRLRQVTRFFVEVMPHVHDPAHWFHHALTLDERVSRVGVAGHAHRVAAWSLDRHGSPVHDSRGTTSSPILRFPGNGSSVARGRRETLSVVRSRSPVFDTAESQPRQTRRESRARRGPARIARRARAIGWCHRCGRGHPLTDQETMTSRPVGVLESATGPRPGSESHSYQPRASSRAPQAPSFASWSPPCTPTRRARWGTARRKPRIVAVMEEESTAKLLSIEDRPATPRDPITFIGSLEGEFDRRQALALDHPIVEIRLDRQQAEPSVTFGLQRQARRIH